MVNSNIRARPGETNENGQAVISSNSIRGAALRKRMAATWSEVLDLLESGKRRTKDGRTLVQAWADLTLEDPAAMFALVNERILPKEQEHQSNQQLTSIQNLYLTAIQQAAKMPPPLLASPGLPDDDDAW